MRKKPASGVLASLRGSPYGSSTIRLFARCGLAGRPFCASCSYSDTNTRRELIAMYGAKSEFFRNLLGALLSLQTRIIEMGYLSSECLGTVDVDVLNNRCGPTLADNFFEFVEVGGDASAVEPVLLHQLQAGPKYTVIVTTRNGLYRYAMNDIIEAVGYFNRTPTIHFVQEGKGVTNITGEKLYEHQVTEAVGQVLIARGLSSECFVMLADVENSCYTLCLEHVSSPGALGILVEERLSSMNIEFKAKRASGRLQPIHVLQLRPGTGDVYRQHCVSKGEREAQFKLICLQYAHECTFDFERHGN